MQGVTYPQVVQRLGVSSQESNLHVSNPYITQCRAGHIQRDGLINTPGVILCGSYPDSSHHPRVSDPRNESEKVRTFRLSGLTVRFTGVYRACEAGRVGCCGVHTIGLGSAYRPAVEDLPNPNSRARYPQKTKFVHGTG